MKQSQPTITSKKGRQFACSAAAVQAIVINEEEKILLLSSPTRNQNGEWQTVSGGLEAEESILDGTLREVREELGDSIRVRPLGVVHVQTFHYDENVQFMISVYYLFAYEGGEVLPGDDMKGSKFRWWGLNEIHQENAHVVIPPSDQGWILQRAVDIYHIAKNEKVNLQEDLS